MQTDPTPTYRLIKELESRILELQSRIAGQRAEIEQRDTRIVELEARVRLLSQPNELQGVFRTDGKPL